MRTIALAVCFFGVVGALVSACDDDGGRRETVPATVTRAALDSSTATAVPPSTVIARANGTPNPVLTEGPPSTVLVPADSPTEPPAGLPPTETSGITIALARFDCGAYEFQVQSSTRALYKVHWTTTSPADPELANHVSDNEVSQSPGERTFSHEKQDWAHEGSNRISVTAWDVDGSSVTERREIDC